MLRRTALRQKYAHRGGARGIDSLSLGGGGKAMGARKSPDLSPDALCHLVAGMTADEVEAVIGRYIRPNLHEGRRYYAWIALGAMLRAFFEGPNNTLSAAVLNTSNEQKRLDLHGNIRRRTKSCTVYRTWFCITCRKSYRQSVIPRFVCPICHVACEHVSQGIQVPRPSRIQAWHQFWIQYKIEKALLDQHSHGKLREDVQLEIFGLRLKSQVPAKQKRSRTNRSPASQGTV